MKKKRRGQSKREGQNERESGAMTEKGGKRSNLQESERNVGAGLTQFRLKICKSGGGK